MTAKDQNLYKAVLQNISNLIPQFQPAVSMSDWEVAPRNAVQETNLMYKIMDVGSISASAFDRKQKLGLAQIFAENQGFAAYGCTLFNCYPFLPTNLIQQTYNLLKSPNLPDTTKFNHKI